MDGVELVGAVICSLDGGINGLNLERELSIIEEGVGTIRYALVDVTGEQPDQVFTVTIGAV